MICSQAKQVSRQDHARRRQRGPHGRFLGAKASEGARQDNSDPHQQHQPVPQQPNAPASDCRHTADLSRQSSSETQASSCPSLVLDEQNVHRTSRLFRHARGPQPHPQWFSSPPCPPLPPPVPRPPSSVIDRRSSGWRQVHDASAQGATDQALQAVMVESSAGATGSLLSYAGDGAQMEYSSRPVVSQQNEAHKAHLLKNMHVLSQILMKHQLAYQQLEGGHQR